MTVIVVGSTQRETSIVPSVAGSTSRIHFDGGANIMDEGQLILTADPPPDNKYVILRETGSGSTDKFTIDKDGQVSGSLVSSADIDNSLVKRSNAGTDINVLNTDTLEITSGINLLEDSTIAFLDSTRIFLDSM